MPSLSRALAAAVPLVALAVPAGAQSPIAPETASIAGVQQALAADQITCRGLIQAYLHRIAAYDRAGPKLAAIRALNPQALAQAEAIDRQAQAERAMRPLACTPLVLKDNYDTAEMPTTGGSASLVGAQPRQDAPVVARLRAVNALNL